MILKNLKLQLKMILNAGVPVALFIVLGIVCFFTVNILRNNVTDLAGSMEKVIEANRAMQEAGSIRSLLLGTESAQRAFLISGEKTHLDKYRQTADKLENQFKVVNKLVADPVQKKRLVDIEAYFNEWRDQAAGPEIAARQKVDIEAVARVEKQKAFLETADKVKVAELIEPKFLAQFQTVFTKATGLANLVVEADGKPVKEQTFDGFTSYCFGPKGESIRNSKLGGNRCELNDAQGGKKAAETGKPAVYECHSGLVDFGVPIMLHGKQIGSWLGGQVLTSAPDLTKIRKYAQELGDVNPEALVKAVQKVPIMSRKRIDASADMLWLFAASAAQTGYERLELAFSKAAIEEDRDLRDQVVALLASGKGTQIIEKATTELNAFMASLRDFSLQRKNEVLIAQDKSEKTAGMTIKLLVFGGIAAFLLSLAFAMLIARSIVRPIENTLSLADAVATGDFSKRIASDSRDEIGALGKSLNHSCANVGEMLENVRDVAQKLAGEADGLLSRSDQMERGAQRMSGDSKAVTSASESLSESLIGVAASAEELASSVNIVAAAIEEMSASTSEVSKNCSGASEMTKKADAQVQSANQVMEKLNRSADEIGKVLDAITGIAEQTNLLALNATIEAARAGESGKGFAVVANEIKELAKQTASATEEIAVQINDMQHNTENAVTAIDGISALMSEVNHITQTIATAVEEQSATTNEISGSVGNASTATDEVSRIVQNAAEQADTISQSIQNVDRAAQETTSGVTQTSESAKDLAKLSDVLRDLVGKFKTV
jgi:methyl-accepting chemotaxis protein